MVDERAHLRQADRHIAQAERLIAEQQLRIDDLTSLGQDASLAYAILQNMTETLVEYRRHRVMILDALCQQEKPRNKSPQE